MANIVCVNQGEVMVLKRTMQIFLPIKITQLISQIIPQHGLLQQTLIMLLTMHIGALKKHMIIFLCCMDEMGLTMREC